MRVCNYMDAHNALGNTTMIFHRNNTGAPVIVTHNANGRVTFYKMHVNTGERIGSPVTLSATKFFLRYA